MRLSSLNRNKMQNECLNIYNGELCYSFLKEYDLGDSETTTIVIIEAENHHQFAHALQKDYEELPPVFGADKFDFNNYDEEEFIKKADFYNTFR